MKMKHGLLAAVASAALIAGAGGAFAQAEKNMGAQGGAQVQEQGKTQGGAQVQGGAKEGTEARGGAQAQGTGKAESGGAQTQTQGSGKAQTGQSGTDKMDKKESAQGRQDSKPGQAQTPDRDSQKRDSAQKPGDADKPAQLDDQQRTKISATVRDQKGLKRVERTNINFNINVGTVVPRTIGLAPLPAPIYAIVPAYRGYLYILVGDELLIVHPRTYEIVAVIPA
jgi:hypothetical protein